jgi:hypothetical protein
MTITEFEQAPSEVKVDLIYKYRLVMGLAYLDMNDKKEIDRFYLWLKLKDESQLIRPAL